MIQILCVTPVSACFELKNDAPYYAPVGYTVFLNGEQQFRGDTNVFSVFSLRPGTDYVLRLDYDDGAVDEAHFTTKTVTAGVNVKDFGAVGDGVTNDTAAVQAAIHFLPEGGLLHFPAGSYLTGPLALKSHITLEFGQEAVLLGDPVREHYPILPGCVTDCYSGEEVHFGAFEGNAVPMYQALVTAEYARDITIVGPGTVDGNAQNSDFWTHFTEFPTARPRLFFFNRCREITVHGLTAQNSASWQFHPYFSQQVGLYDLFIKAPKDSPNTDAIDPEACDGVQIIGCRFTVGDDCIAIKSGKIDIGRKFRQSADHHTIRNCLMAFGHGAVTLGSEIGAGVTNLSVYQCLFRGTDRGLRIKTRRGRGKYAVIDGVEFSNIRMDNVMAPLVMNMYYFCDPDGHEQIVWSKEPHPVDDTTPYLGSFLFRDMECTDCEWAAGYFYGLTEQPIGSVTIENVNFTFKENASSGRPAMMDYIEEECKRGLYFNCVRKVSLKNVTMTGQSGERLITINVDEVMDE